MKIRTSELRSIADQLFDHLEETGHHEVEIDEDYYLDIGEKERYSPYTRPTKPNIGQLTDDWAELVKIAEGRAKPVNYCLVWLSTILRRVGEICVG